MRFDELKTPAYVIDEKCLFIILRYFIKWKKIPAATYCWRRKHFQHMQNIR